MKKLNLLATAILVCFTLFSCQNDEMPAPDTQLDALGQKSNDNGKALGTLKGQIWADCELFQTVGTPAVFDGHHKNYDKLFNVGAVGGHFKDGVGAISESKPGDQDYNGGKWALYLPKGGVDVTKYEDACSVEDLDLNDFEAVPVWFQCPLLAVRGNN